MSGFSFVKARDGSTPSMVERELAASVSVDPGDLLEFVSGKAKRVNAQTDKPDYVSNEDVDSTADGGEKALVMDAMRGNGIWEVGFTPLYNDLVDQNQGASSSTVAEIVAAGRSSNDLVGGIIYCVETKEQRIITASTATSGGGAQTGNILITVTVPFSVSLAGKTIRVVAFGYGTAALKLDSSAPHNLISNAVADLTGGNVTVYDVNMKAKRVQVVFNV